jgi:phospholipid/cholesterol/gamma-HCH transport system substrate-binding protein
METRANHVIVGAVTLVLLAVLAAFIIWIARLNEGAQNQYDIFFKQSVGGLAQGSQVSYSGVPVGQIKNIELWKKDPSFVRVRITVDVDVPVLVGTTATIQSSFTGVSTIQLEGATKGSPPITEPGPEGVPVIPTKPGIVGELLNTAPVLLERLTTLSERLNQLLSEENQKSITGILANTDKITTQMAEASPKLKGVLTELEGTLAQATATLGEFEKVAGQANNLLGEEGGSLASEMRDALTSARKAADQLEGALSDSRPGLRQFSESTLPAAEAAIRELRATSRSLRNVIEKVDEQGASALVGGPDLPDYEP